MNPLSMANGNARFCRAPGLTGMLIQAVLIIIFLSNMLNAQESGSKPDESKKEKELKEVVVTATRSEKALTDAPGSIEVIAGKSLENRDTQSLDGALKSVPGMYSRRELMFSTLQPVINIRGIAGQNRTLVMMDGITLNEPRAGAAYFDGIAVDDVDRIEVVKGPFSSLYGGYAMGGVINVITRMPQKRDFTLKSGFGNSWSEGRGFDSLFSEYISYGDRIGKFSLLTSYSRKWSDGYPYQLNVQTTAPPAGYIGYMPTTGYTGATAYIVGDKGNGSPWNDGLDIKLQYDFAKATKLGIRYMRNNYRYEYDDPNTIVKNAAGDLVFGYANGSQTVREASYLAGGGGRTRSIYDLTFETELDSIKSKIQGGVVDQGKSFYITPGSGATTTRTGGPGTYSDAPAREYYADLQLTAPVFTKQILTWGGSFHNDNADSITYNLTNWKDEDSKTTTSSPSGGAANTYALFLQDEIELASNLTAYLGGRLDWWKTYDGYNSSGSIATGSAFSASPKAAIVYKPFDKTSIRASGGKAFRPPSLYELYSNYVGSYTINANPTLKPETTWSWDAGVEQELWHGAKATATYFDNYMSDLIYTQTISSVLRARVNIGKARSRGVEVGASQKLNENVRIFGDFTYTNATVTENAASVQSVGKQLVDVPKRMYNIGIEGAYRRFTGTLVGRYVSKRYQTDGNTDVINHVYTSYDPFFTADAKISYRFPRLVTLSFSIDNLFNKDYYTYYKSPGRSWYSEAAFRF